MPTRSNRLPWGVALLSLALLGCDPPSAGRSKDDTLLQRGGQQEGTRDPVADAALGDAKVILRKDGTVEIYDRNGELRTQVIDPRARFVATLEPITGTKEWAKPHPQLSVPLAGLSDWLTQRGRDRRAKAAIEAAGLTESQRMLVSIAEAAELTERRLGELDGELAALWADTSKPAHERRRLLFARWDENVEGGGDDALAVLRVTEAAGAPDAIRARAGERARATIEEFVRRRLPAGGGDAYAADELAALNRGRKSRQRFEPYRGAAAADETTG